MTHIVCFHLYNDFSGSPIVLRMVLDGLLQHGYQVDLVTSDGGVLDTLQGRERFRKHSYTYRFSPNPIATMLRYMAVQCYTFCLALRWAFRKDVVFYVNTLLPVGPALAGRLMGKRVVYHYHENAHVKGVFYQSLAWMMQRLAHEIICVSHYQAASLAAGSKVRVVPNALPETFVDRMRPDAQRSYDNRNILMIASLKSYKGVREFMELSARMPDYRFTLVLNDSQTNINDYIKAHRLEGVIGRNLTVYPRQSDVAPFYTRASVLLNLSDRTRVIETFGMTVLEAMSAGLPVIVPTEGGVAELVCDGENGYRIDVGDMDRIERRLKEMFLQKNLYIRLSEKALQYARKFDSTSILRQIECVLEESL